MAPVVLPHEGTPLPATLTPLVIEQHNKPAANAKPQDGAPLLTSMSFGTFQRGEKFEAYHKAFVENMQNKPIRHDKASVLLLSWDAKLDDLGVKTEVDKLQKFFKKTYGFRVTREQLKDRNPQHQLNKLLASFMEENDDDGALLIIYYAGHGSFRNRGYQNDGMQWHAQSQPSDTEQERNRIAWSGAEHAITKTKADILVIFDCCQAGGFGGYKVRSSRPNFEFIAACSTEEVAAPPGEKSFTSALMWALEKLKDEDRPFTTITLIDKIKKYPRLREDQTPELQRRDPTADGCVWIAPIGANGPTRGNDRHSERRQAHHQYIDLRLHFYRRVNPDDAKNVAQHLSRLVDGEDSFAKHIDLIDVSDSVSKYINIWRATTNGKRKRTASTDVPPQVPIAAAYITDSPLAMDQEVAPLAKRPRLTTPPQSRDALYHLRMFFDCSLQWIATRIRPAPDRTSERPQRRDEDSNGTET